MRTIVVGVADRRSDGTLAWAANAAHGARLVVVHAYLPPPPLPELGWDADPDEREWRLDLLEHHWCAPLRALGVPFRAEVLIGPVVPVLARVARRDGADLVVVGAGRPRRWRRPLGTLLSQACPHPVAVVPRGPVAVPRQANAVMTSWP